MVVQAAVTNVAESIDVYAPCTMGATVTASLVDSLSAARRAQRA